MRICFSLTKELINNLNIIFNSFSPEISDKLELLISNEPRINDLIRLNVYINALKNNTFWDIFTLCHYQNSKIKIVAKKPYPLTEKIRSVYLNKDVQVVEKSEDEKEIWVEEIV